MKPSTTKTPITSAQLKALHVQFTKMGFDASERHDFILDFTSGRTASSRELTMHEARMILERIGRDERTRHLEECKRMVGAIYHLSFSVSFLNQGFSSDTEADKQMNIAKINTFCLRCSKAHKKIQEMNRYELEDVKKQLEAIARKEKNK